MNQQVMKTLKRLSAVIIFLVAAFFGAQVLDPYGVWGDVGVFGSLIIVMISFGIMAGAVSLWRSTVKKKDTAD